ncbi:MAG: YncE family protein [Bacteroidota bacterium]
MKKLLFLLFTVSLTSCLKDKPPVVQTTLLPGSSGSEGVFIVNEGTFNFGNAGISYYRFSDGAVSEDLFKTANNRKLGDVCQSMTRHNGKLYVVVNNSQKIEVVDPVSFVSQGQIKGLLSPRYFLGVSINKAYVSDFKSGKVSVVDLITNTVSKTISCPGWTEEMALAYGKAYITNYYSNYLYVIDTRTDLLTDSINVGYGGTSIVQDKFGKLWVAVSGNSDAGENGKLVVIDPSDDKVEQSLPFASGRPSNLFLNAGSDTLYYLDKHVWKMPVSSVSLPTSPVVNTNGKTAYGFGVNPANGEIYVADALDYVQRGLVYRYSPAGNLISSFKVGYIPSRFYFY